MAINLQRERPLSFREAQKAMPFGVAVSTLHRWRLRGVRGIRLETCLIGGRRYTTREAIERFIAATTAVDRPNGTDLISQTADAAEAELKRERI